MKSDIQIAQEAKMEPIVKIAEKLNLTEDDIAFPIIEKTEEGLLLKEINPLFTLDDILQSTEANLIISDDLRSEVA